MNRKLVEQVKAGLEKKLMTEVLPENVRRVYAQHVRALAKRLLAQKQ